MKAELIGRWVYPEKVLLKTGDVVEYSDMHITDEGQVPPFEYRVVRANGDTTEWKEMIFESVED